MKKCDCGIDENSEYPYTVLIEKTHFWHADADGYVKNEFRPMKEVRLYLCRNCEKLLHKEEK